MSPDALDALASEPPPAPPPIGDALAAELARLAPVAPRRPVRQMVALLAISLAYIGALLAMRHIRADLDELPVYWLIAVGLAWFAGFVVPIALVLVPSRASMLPHWRAAAGVAVVVAVVFPALGLIMHPSGPSSGYLGWEHLLRGHGCLWSGLLVASVPVALGAWWARGGLPVRSRWACAALGAGAGSLGGVFLHLHCHVADGPHIGVIHGGVVAVAAVLAALLGPRLADRPLR